MTCHAIRPCGPDPGSGIVTPAKAGVQGLQSGERVWSVMPADHANVVSEDSCMDLRRRSIEIILENQAASGAYIASPAFPTYRYTWFRDGSFTAYAMDRVGQMESARRFHDWAARAINRREETVRRAIERAARGEPLAGADHLHTRYMADGEDGVTEEWPNFQLDGFGTWLWALEQHVALSGANPAPDWLRAAGLAAGYLAALWRQPCYDCWEEYPEKVHPATLGAIYAGLGAASRLDGVDRSDIQREIHEEIDTRGNYGGYFVKYVGSYTVDASLLGLAVPYGVVPADEPRMRETVRRIEASLARGGGVHRYPTDTYYGGGEWVLLTAWLGWYHALAGDRVRAAELLTWVEACANDRGELPEQLARTLIDSNYLEPWNELWGSSACPLLWSHAEYLILREELDGVDRR